MYIERITQIDESIVDAFKKLMPQLTGRDEYPSYDELNKVIESDNVHLCLAYDENKE